MGYFPFFMDIKGKRCMIAGGGKTALRKLEKLMMFEPEIILISPEICGEIEQISGISKVCRRFRDEDLNGAFMAVAATCDEVVNQHIYDLCCEKNILINTVDDINKCGFIFPALVRKDNVTVGITTSGSSPIFARSIRERVDELLDSRQMNLSKLLSRYRIIIKDRFDSEHLRKKASERILDMCLACQELPDDMQINSILEAVEKEK